MALILVVDDEEDACRMLERILAAQGHSVRSFTDGMQALEWLEAWSPDMALLDIKLRGMNGFSVLRHLREHRPETKVIMITGCPCAETSSRAAELGVGDYLVKPLELSDLEDRVHSMLAKAGDSEG